MKDCILQCVTLVSVLAPVVSNAIALVAAITADLSETGSATEKIGRQKQRERETKENQTQGGEKSGTGPIQLSCKQLWQHLALAGTPKEDIVKQPNSGLLSLWKGLTKAKQSTLSTDRKPVTTCPRVPLLEVESQGWIPPFHRTTRGWANIALC